MITESSRLPRASKSKVKGFSLGFNALDTEMSQMVPHYALMPHPTKPLINASIFSTSFPTNAHLLEA